jgi:hypothetical protein
VYKGTTAAMDSATASVSAPSAGRPPLAQLAAAFKSQGDQEVEREELRQGLRYVQIGAEKADRYPEHQKMIAGSSRAFTARSISQSVPSTKRHLVMAAHHGVVPWPPYSERREMSTATPSAPAARASSMSPGLRGASPWGEPATRGRRRHPVHWRARGPVRCEPTPPTGASAAALPGRPARRRCCATRTHRPGVPRAPSRTGGDAARSPACAGAAGG